MEEQKIEHLTAEEVAGWIGRNGPEEIAEDRATHVESCDLCRRTIAMHQEEEIRLQSLVGGARRTPRNGCPPTFELASLAAGLLDKDRSAALLDHASKCDSCGATLRAVTDDLSQEMSDQETQIVAELPSATPDWQRTMTKEMAKVSRRGLLVVAGVWLARAAAVILAIGGGWFAWDQWFASNPERLLAQAYTQQRPYEYRIPGAAYGPVNAVRASRGSFERPSALLKATSEIAEKLGSNPDNAKWLEMRARAEMLDSNYQGAIDTLTRALEQKPDDPALLSDLGMAYALRGEAEKKPTDYSLAMNNLRLSQKARPDSLETIYNLAIVYERLFMYDDALETWHRYLQLDKSGAWNEQAQQHIRDIEQKKK